MIINMEKYIPQFELVKIIESELNGHAKILANMIDITPIKEPSVFELYIDGRSNREYIEIAKRILHNYYDRFFDVHEVAEVDDLLKRVDNGARHISQQMYYKNFGRIHQFAVYRPWDRLIPNEVQATIVFYEIPEKWDGSETKIAAGSGAKLVKAGLLNGREVHSLLHT